MTRRRELGAGVSVMWVIFLIVLLLGTGSYIYLVQSDIQNLKSQAKAAQEDKDDAEKRLEDARQAHLELSLLVGFRSEGGALSSAGALDGKLKELKAQFQTDIGTQDSTAELVMERLVTMAEKHRQDAQAARTQFETELAQRQAAEAAKTDIERTQQAALDAAQGELRDARQRADSTQAAADERYGQLDQTHQQSQTDFRQQESALQQQVAEAQGETDKQRGRVRSLATKVKIIGVEDDPDAADGKVIDASLAGDVYIDVGSKSLLRNGTRFDVYRFDKGGRRVVKGQIEVRELGNTSAVARVVKQNDALDPIAAGDQISNPYFNRGRTKNFVLVGDFPAYGVSFLKQRLMDLGAQVSDVVNSDVDAIILGAKGLEEDAPELSDLPEYKVAQELNIQMLRLAELEPFLRP